MEKLLAAALRLTGHGYEAHGQDVGFVQSSSSLAQEDQFLMVDWADRNNHAATVFKLVGQRSRHVVRGTGDHDGVEGRGFRPALAAITEAHDDIGAANALEIDGRAPGKWFDDFDGEDFLYQTAQHRRLIA